MGDTALTEAFNAAVNALHCLCDAQVCIVVQYIVGPSRRGPSITRAHIAQGRAGPGSEACEGQGQTGMGVAMQTGPTSTPAAGMLRGAGETDLVRFLKGFEGHTRKCNWTWRRGKLSSFFIFCLIYTFSLWAYSKGEDSREYMHNNSTIDRFDIPCVQKSKAHLQ